MSPTYGGYPVADAETAGREVSSTYEGRHLTLLEGGLVHPTHADGFVDKGDPIVSVTGTDPAIVGVSFMSAAAVTDRVAIDTEGIWILDVVGADDSGNVVVAGGDPLFINTTTAVLSKIRDVTTQVPFGYALGIVSSGNTETIAVKVHWMLNAFTPEARIDFAGIDIAAANTDGGIFKAGGAASRITEDTASMRFMSAYFDNGAVAGDSRGLFLQLYLTGAGGGGSATRIATTVENVAGASAYGSQTSLDFSNTGTVTGIGVAMRATLHIANQATQDGTMAAVQAEIYSDGATSDPSGSRLSLIRCLSDGNATGMADVDDDCAFVDFAGFTEATGNMLYDSTGAVPGNSDGSIKIRRPDGTAAYLLYFDAQAA